MSRQNSLSSKRLRRAERAARKAAAKRIPFIGLTIDRKTVLAHRYRAVHGLEFSPAVAAVAINRAVKVGAK